MIHVYPGHKRFQSNHGWLQSYFSFSFAEYFDRNNMHFGHYVYLMMISSRHNVVLERTPIKKWKLLQSF